MKKIELLAPAGNFEALVAAVQNGADAVYFGGKNYGARAFANNFDCENIKRAIEYAHIRDVKTYITVNTLLFDSELEECLNYIQFLYENDADAVIVQDIGIASAIHKLFPKFEMHASTQMSISNLQDALFYKSMGFQRLVLARENSIEEIRLIKEQANIEIESFVHGSLCVSYSGKCLFSYVNGGRSANRGQCAQPCRQKYDIVQKNNLVDSRYYFSMKDLSTIGHLKTIIENGTDSLKIEGRMKRHEYVSTVVKSYREALDALYDNIHLDTEELEKKMANVFNREFTKGFILNAETKKVVNTKTPNNIGTHLGKVIGVNKKTKKIEIKLDEPLSVGDGISLGEHVGRILKNNQVVQDAKKGDWITLDFIGNAKIGDEVRKTSDKSILDYAKFIQSKELKKSPLKFHLEACLNTHPKLQIEDDRGNISEYADQSAIIEKAEKSMVSKAEIKAQLSKLESTPYYLDEINFQMDQNIFIKKSTLNNLRRNGIEILNEKRSILNNRNCSRKAQTIEFFLSGLSIKNYFENKNEDFEISIACRTFEQIDACNECSSIKINVYADRLDLYEYAVAKGLKVYFVTPMMLKDCHIHELESIINTYSPHIVTSSIGYAKHTDSIYKNQGINRDIRLDYASNIANKLSYHLLGELDFISGATLSLENCNLQYQNLHSYAVSKLEFPVLLHPILMITEFCPYKSDKPCKKCSIENTELLNENKTVILKKDMFCRQLVIDNHLFDNRASTLLAKKDGVTRYRVDLLNENYNETKKYINEVMEILK